jgi:hypothetical protein
MTALQRKAKRKPARKPKKDVIRINQGDSLLVFDGKHEHLMVPTSVSWNFYGPIEMSFVNRHNS